jgi:hypothetical protein
VVVEAGEWTSIMRKKYLRIGGVFYTKNRPGDSPLWIDMLQVKELYLCGRRMQVGNGKLTNFWSDAWCGQCPLKDIYNICVDHKIKVVEEEDLGWRFTFIRFS